MGAERRNEAVKEKEVDVLQQQREARALGLARAGIHSFTSAPATLLKRLTKGLTTSPVRLQAKDQIKSETLSCPFPIFSF